MKIIAGILWVAAIVLISLMIITNVNEVKTFNSAAIKTERLIVGQSSAKPVSEDISLVAFMGREYELVMVDENRYEKKIIFFGESDGKYYSATETVPTRFLQEINEVRIVNDGSSTEIIMGKDIVSMVFLSVYAALILGAIGFLLVTD